MIYKLCKNLRQKTVSVTTCSITIESNLGSKYIIIIERSEMKLGIKIANKSLK